MNGYAYIGKIIKIDPIEGADKIVSATAVCGSGGKWVGVVQKQSTNLGDLAVVFVQDALLPEDSRWAFMESRRWIVRIAKFKGSPSECLIMPLSLFPECTGGEVGDDVTTLLCVTKYVKPLPESLNGEITGGFPGFIPKTDEDNFQSVPAMVDFMRNNKLKYYYSLKYDGTSCTVYKHNGHFGVCSRRYEVAETESSAYWKVARQLNLEELLPEGYALQLEIYGEGIQKNPLGVKGLHGAVFNKYDIKRGRYEDLSWAMGFCLARDIPFVEVLGFGVEFTLSDNELRKLAEGNYPGTNKAREGIVIRTLNETYYKGSRVSFKVINPDY